MSNEQPGPQGQREPDAMCHATHWRMHLDEWSHELMVQPYDAEKVEAARLQGRDGPPWPVWIGRAPTQEEPETQRLLSVLVARGVIHPSRLQDIHTVSIYDDGGWHMKHPLSCELAFCKFDRAIRAADSLTPGDYFMDEPNVASLRAPTPTPEKSHDD